MSGKNSGVKARILSEEPRALFIHCFNHALNLAASDTLKKIVLLKNALSISEELLILFQKSTGKLKSNGVWNFSHKSQFSNVLFSILISLSKAGEFLPLFHFHHTFLSISTY